MTALSLTDLHRRVKELNELPSLPAILFPVLNQLNGNSDEINLQKAVELIAHDSALSTQILHMANSPLFGSRRRVTTLRAAAITLGVSRLRDIVTSCGLMQLSPKTVGMDVTSFWEHSLACALIARNFARKLSYPDPERAYLAGLVHDLGILVHMLLIPREFSKVFESASQSRQTLRETELEQIGISHEITGGRLAAHWHLFDYLAEVMRCHHDVTKATLEPPLTAIVLIADLLCRTSGLGYGYEENLAITLQDETAWKILCPQSPHLDLVCFTLEIESHLKEVRSLVSVLFRV